MRRTALLMTVFLLAGCTAHASGAPKPSTSAPVAEQPPVDYTRWAAGKSAPVKDTLYPQHGNPGLDVLHYGLDLSWAPGTSTLTGTATEQIRPVTSATEINLDFKPYTLDGVTVDGVKTDARVEHEKLIVPVAVTADRPVTLVVQYHGKPSTTPLPSHRGDAEPLGLTVAKDKSIWTMQEPYGAYTWYPANDQPSDKALYDIGVTAPEGWSAIAAGTPAGQQGNTFRYTSSIPMASYLQTLAVGKYKKLTATGPQGLPLTYWYRPGVDDKLVPSLKKSPQFLTFLESHYGKFPLPTAGIVLVDSDSAMETQQMVTLGDRIFKKYGKAELSYFEEDILHEYAHQWFGDTVTPATWTDLWLNEGWAQYSQFQWEQSRDHFSDAQLEAFLRHFDAVDRKKVGPPGKPKAGNFAEENVYLCPSAMLMQLYDALGKKKFFQMATAWVQGRKYTTQSRATFIAFVNKQTGKNYTKLINTWLDSTTTPA
jgi:aminopeptidase N